MASDETIAVLGAGGTMGLPMAANLARAGFAVRGFNRSADKARPLTDDGVVISETAAESARGATIILTMLADTDAVLAVMEGADGALAGAGDDVLWLQMSTIGEAGTDRCTQLAAERGVTFVDAPVLGTKQPAQEGKLIVLASGPAELESRLAPVFEAIGQRTMWVGDAGAGSRLKLAVNGWLLAVVEGAAESLAAAEGLGLDPALVLEAVGGGPLDLPYLQLKGKAMIAREFDPSFSLRLAAKDAGLVMEAAEAHGLDLPVLGAIRRRMEQGIDAHGDQDLSATFLTSAPD